MRHPNSTTSRPPACEPSHQASSSDEPNLSQQGTRPRSFLDDSIKWYPVIRWVLSRQLVSTGRSLPDRPRGQRQTKRKLCESASHYRFLARFAGQRQARLSQKRLSRLDQIESQSLFLGAIRRRRKLKRKPSCMVAGFPTFKSRFRRKVETAGSENSSSKKIKRSSSLAWRPLLTVFCGLSEIVGWPAELRKSPSDRGKPKHY